MAHLGVLHPVGHLTHRGEDRVDRDGADREVLLVVVGAAVAHSLLDGQRHLQLGSDGQSADVEVLVDYLHAAGRIQLPGGERPSAGTGEGQHLRQGIVHAHHQALDVEDDVHHVLLHAGDGGELVVYAFDPDRRDGGAGYAGQQRAPQGVAEGVAETRLQRLDDEAGTPLADRFGLYLWTLNDQRLQSPASLTLIANRARPPAAPAQRCRSAPGWGGRSPPPAARRDPHPAIRAPGGRRRCRPHA